MANYKKRLKLKKQYQIILAVLITWLMSVGITLLIAWRVDQINKQENQNHGTVNIFKNN